MNSLFTKSNLAAAGCTTLAVMLTLNVTAKQPKYIQGGAAFAAALVGVVLASKI